MRILLCLLFLAYWAIPTQGQALLRGVVYERLADRPVHSVSIHILETTLQDISDDQGEYLIQNIPPGVYKVAFQKEGYQTAIRVITVAKTEDGPTQVFSLGVGMDLLAPTNLGESLTIGHGFDRKALHSPFATEQVKGWQMNRWQPVTLAEGLSRLTGIWQTGASYGLPSLSVRGLDERRLSMAWEGVPISPSMQRWGASPALSVMDPMAIGAIEAQRGTGGITSGLGNTGGQINFSNPELTFSGQGVEAHGKATYFLQSPSQVQQGRLALSFHSPKIAVRVGATGALAEAVRPGNGGANIPATGYDRRHADAQASIRINPRQELSLGYRFGHLSNVDFEGNARPSANARFLDERMHQIGFARLRTFFPEGKWVKKLDLQGSYQEFDETRQGSLLADVGPDERYPQQENSLETYGGKIEILSVPNALWHFVNGVDGYVDVAGGTTTVYDQQTEGFITRRGMLPNQSQSGQFSLYSLHTLDILKLRLTVGGRAQADMRRIAGEGGLGEDWQSLRAGWSVSGMYPLSEDIQLVSNLQSGYRAPSLFELAGQGPIPTGLAIGNDSLLAEQSLTSEFGLKAQTDRIKGSLMLYRTRFNDWIGYAPATLEGQSIVEGLPVFQPDNMGKVFLSGLEAALEVPVTRGMSVYGNLTYTYGMRVNNSNPISRIPPVNSRLGMHYHHKLGIWGQVEWRYTDQQNRLSPLDVQDPALAVGVGSWQTFDVKVGYDFRWGYASIGFLNLLDERFQYFGTDYLQPGRRLVASLQIGF